MLGKSFLAMVIAAFLSFSVFSLLPSRQAGAQAPTLAACPAGATLSVSSPVAAAPATVNVQIQPPQNIKAAAQADPASLHVHYFLDTDPTPAGQVVPQGNPKIIHSGSLSQDFSPLAPGSHTVWVVLGQLDHTACATRGAVTFNLALPSLDAVHRQQLEALSRGDISTVMALFSENPTFGLGDCSPVPCVGRPAVQREIEREVAAHLRATVLGSTMTGSTLTTRVEVTNDTLKGLGLDRVRFSISTTFAGDRVASVTAQPDLSDPQTAAFVRQAGALIRPPSTGSGGLLP